MSKLISRLKISFTFRSLFLYNDYLFLHAVLWFKKIALSWGQVHVGPGTDGPGSVGPGTDGPGTVVPGSVGPGSVM